MANYATLKAAVADVVKTNGAQEITGANLQAVLLSIINSIGGGGYIFAGVATPSTNPGTPDQNVFYIGGAGTYANFGDSYTVPAGYVGVFKFNGSWIKESISLGSLGCVSLIPSSEMIPNINSVDGILDFGEDPILLIGAEQYVLKTINSADPSKHRAIRIYNGTNTACKLVFNTTTLEFEQLSYTTALAPNQVLIGGIRTMHANGTYYGFISADFPFMYTVDAPSLVSASDFITFYSRLANSNEETANRAILNIPLPKRTISSVSVRFTSTGWACGFNGMKSQYTPPTLGSGSYDSGWVDGRYWMFTTDVSNDSNYYFLGFSKGSSHTSTFSKTEFLSVISCIRFFSKAALPVFDVTSRKDGVYDSLTKIVAHRGYHLNGVPENSLDSCRLAASMGYDYCETDICPTADNVLVLMHDATINRTMYTTAYEPIEESIAVNSLTLSQLRSGYVLIADDPRMRKPIPTYEEFLHTCRKYKIHPVIEIKNTGTTQANVLNAYEMAKEILGDGNFSFTSFSYELLDYARTLDENVDLLYIGNSIIGTNNTISGESRENKHNLWNPRITGYGLDYATVKAYHMKGMRVGAWLITEDNYGTYVDMCLDMLTADKVSPNLEHAHGHVFNSDFGWEDFDMTGVTVTDNVVTSNGETSSHISYISQNVSYGALLLEIVYKGAITVRIDTDSYTFESETMTSIRISRLTSNHELSFVIVMPDAGTQVSEIRGKNVQF